MKKLYAGPWTGEWGWELCSWNPSLRHIAKDYDHITVEIQPGMEYLYEFADEILINPRKPNYDMYKGDPSKPAFKPPQGVHSITPGVFWNRHARKEFRSIKVAGRDKNLHPKEWKRLGTEKSNKVADVMCAFRGPKRFKGRSYPEKQYPEEQCIALATKLLEAGYSVACYGCPENLYVDGTIDYRNAPLADLCGALAQSRVVVGPSSGTIHLASLCGAPHVTWYGRPVVSMERYMSYWNPFSTPATFLDGKAPPVEKAFQHTVERMDPATPVKNWIKR